MTTNLRKSRNQKTERPQLDFSSGGAAGPGAYEPPGRDATPPEVAAELVAFLLSAESAGVSGRLISAVWDPWRDDAGRALLRGPSDFGRLRRIDAQRFHDTAGAPP